MRLGLAQINTVVGDIDGNAAKVREWIGRAAAEGCDLVVFPELTLTGYPADDLYLQPHFARASAEALGELAAYASGIAAAVGFAEPVPGADRGPGGRRERPSCHNAVGLLADGQVRAVHRKQHLPSYGVFDEVRHFLPGSEPRVAAVGPEGIPVGLTICEDCWDGGALAREEAAAGAGMIVNASASPWHRGRGPGRDAVFTDLAGSLGVPVALCNLVGGQDGLVFEGRSVVAGPGGEIVARAARFEEDLLVADPFEAGSPPQPAPDAGAAEVRRGLVLGLRDYVAKNRFPGVVLGVSGGIDSALVAALATEALGPERVTCLVMPSPHSSTETQEDARRLAARLGAHALEVPIGEPMGAYEAVLAGGEPGDDDAGVVLENIQARIRGNLVMAISNRDGSLALSCGNKSEAAVGYATLYGDMAGGLSPIKDVPKGLVYELAGEVNRTGVPGSAAGRGEDPIPPGIIDRPPTAELRPGQLDTESLPPYPLLDRALEAHVERDLSRAEMLAEGIDAATADRAIDLVRATEYKRRQSAPGIRVTGRSLDRDRRMPITNRYRPDGP